MIFGEFFFSTHANATIASPTSPHEITGKATFFIELPNETLHDALLCRPKDSGGWLSPRFGLPCHLRSKTKRVYGSNWKSATVNGTVLEVRKQTKDNNKNLQTYVYASYMFPTQVSRSKELHLKSVKKFWPTDEPATTTIPPQSEVGPTINQPW